ncbi:hypothetical protein BDM02DRAFT_3121698, partial [Thelephora ganbajun]
MEESERWGTLTVKGHYIQVISGYWKPSTAATLKTDDGEDNGVDFAEMKGEEKGILLLSTNIYALYTVKVQHVQHEHV